MSPTVSRVESVRETHSQQGREPHSLTVSRAGSVNETQLSAGQGASERLNSQQGSERHRDSTVSRAEASLTVSWAGSVTETHSQQGRECQRDSQSAGQRVSERLIVSRAGSVRDS